MAGLFTNPGDPRQLAVEYRYRGVLGGIGVWTPVPFESYPLTAFPCWPSPVGGTVLQQSGPTDRTAIMAASTPVSQPVAVQRIAYIPFGLIVAIVLLRLATGWHFYREGTKKLSYNPETGKVSLNFSAEGFLRNAVGPLRDTIRSRIPNFHDWEGLLAKPWQYRRTTEEEEEKLAEWERDYAKRRKEAEDKGEEPPFEFSPHLAYSEWATRIVEDWQEMVDGVKAIDGMSEDQMAAAQDALVVRRQQLSDYLASQASDIVEWKHELWRLQQMEGGPGAQGIPFEKERIAEKRAETTAATAPWLAQVRAIERSLHEDLRGILNAEQLEDATVNDKYDELLADKQGRDLYRMNVAITALIIGVGVCLMLGLFTRLAALGGLLFLCSVIAVQPPWIAGPPAGPIDPFLYQLVEIAGLLVLFAAGAGRWAGLDFFFRRCCGRKESV
jgi:uncharacterized membrane protein YphA (DoxX/SURF4 family)